LSSSLCRFQTWKHCDGPCYRSQRGQGKRVLEMKRRRRCYRSASSAYAEARDEAMTDPVPTICEVGAADALDLNRRHYLLSCPRGKVKTDLFSTGGDRLGGRRGYILRQTVEQIFNLPPSPCLLPYARLPYFRARRRLSQRQRSIHVLLSGQV
jgi:hypothetical protein